MNLTLRDVWVFAAFWLVLLVHSASAGVDVKANGVQIGVANSIDFTNSTGTFSAGRVQITFTGGGGIVPPWTNIAGILQPNGLGANTNAVKIYPWGGITIGTNATAWWGPLAQSEMLVGFSDTSKGEPNLFAGGFGAGVSSGTNSAFQFEGSADSASVSANYYGFQTSQGLLTSLPKLLLTASGTIRTDLNPTAPDGSTPYTFDTSLLHTSGNLAEFKNKGTNRFQVDTLGGLYVGGATGLVPLNNGTVFRSRSDPLLGQPDLFEFDIGIETNGVDRTRVIIDGDSTFAQFRTVADFAPNWVMYADASTLELILRNSGVPLFYAQPFAAASTTPYTQDTSLLHTSGNLFAQANLALNHFTIGATNGIATPQITAYGGTSQPWQFGKVVEGVSVALTVTNYVEVSINGVLKKLALAQ